MILVLDIDGTIADNEHRAHLLPDWEKFLAPEEVAKDTLIPGVASAIKCFQDLNYTLFFLTGRNESLRLTTQAWLLKHLDLDVPDERLLMRPPGNLLNASEYKQQELQRLRRDHPEPFLLIDDDPHMWNVGRQFGVVLAAPRCWEHMFPESPATKEEFWKR